MNLITLSGQRLEDHIESLGRLRIQVFREWPYIYEGNLSYERNYLSIYAKNPESIVGLLHDGEKLVGATTAIPMELEDTAFQKPLNAMGIKSSEVMYFGESILLPEYRGQGWGQKFMDLRLGYAREIKRTTAAFCAVIRDPQHPLRPKDYRPLNDFWKKNGFEAIENAYAIFSWKDLGQTGESEKRLQFWTRTLK